MILAAELFVKDVMKNWDSSHDWWHAERVRQVAVSLAVEEGLTEESQELVCHCVHFLICVTMFVAYISFTGANCLHKQYYT